MSALWDTKWGTEVSPNAGDWAISDPTVETGNVGGLKNQDQLGTAIILCLFTDGAAPDYMIDMFNLTYLDQFTWHGNTFGIEPDESEIGSLMFLIERMPLNDYTARMAEHYAAEALQPLVSNKWVNSFNITSSIDKILGKIVLTIQAIMPGKPPATYFADLFPLQ